MSGVLRLCIVVLSLLQLGSAAASGTLVYAIEFARSTGEPVAWLRAEGFELKLGAEQLDTRFTKRGLILESDRETAALFVKSLDLPEAKRVRITWGVDRYPDGVDWDRGKQRTPLAVMFWLGEEKLDSGALFVPDSPYFTGLFLGAREQEGRAYTGRYYKRGGRYFCQPCRTPEGRTVVTEFDLEDAFRRSFGGEEMPPVSAFGFQVNTKDTTGGSRAFIKRVEFLSS